MSNTQLVEAVYDFAEHQRLVLGRSEATIKGYTSDLLDLAKTIDSFSSFTLPRLRNWLAAAVAEGKARSTLARRTDRKSTRLNSSHVAISYAVFCLKKKITHSLKQDRNM